MIQIPGVRSLNISLLFKGSVLYHVNVSQAYKLMLTIIRKYNVISSKSKDI